MIILSSLRFMRFWIGLFLSLIFIGCSEPASIQPVKHIPEPIKVDSIPKKVVVIPKSEIESIKKYFNRFVKKRRFNGNILVAKKGEIIFDTVSGYANIRRRVKLQDSSVMQLASVTKPITATILLQLVEEGKIKISDTITNYLPQLPKHYSRITVKHLLAHRSGLSQYYYYCDDLISDREKLIYNDTVLCVMDFHNPGHYFPPGRKHNYCNTNYLLLASIIEHIEGKRFVDVVDERIVKKCNMEHSYVFNLRDSVPGNLVYGHTQWNKLFDFDYLDGIVGDKGFFSNAKDLLKFDQMLTNGELLSDSIMELAFTPHNKVRYNKSYGLGWRIKYHKKLDKIVYHTGWWHGNRHIYIRIPKNDYTIIILSNSLRGSSYNLGNILKEFEDFAPVKKEKAQTLQSFSSNYYQKGN